MGEPTTNGEDVGRVIRLPWAERARVRTAKRWLKRRCANLVDALTLAQPPAVAVLCYHSVGADPRCPTELFLRHLEWLHENCTVVRFGAIPAVAPERLESRPVVALTFDDGYRDNYDTVFPLLERYRLPATFFITTGLLEGDRAVVDRFRRLRGHHDIRSLEWAQVCEMRAGGAEFGAHTYSHPNLLRLDPRELERELVRSKELLEERLGEPVTMLAYPFGKPRRHYTSHTVKAARAAGYELGGTTLLRTVRSADDPLTLPRLLVGGDDVPTLREKLAGSWNFLGRWQEHAPVWAARLLSPDDFRV